MNNNQKKSIAGNNNNLRQLSNDDYNVNKKTDIKRNFRQNKFLFLVCTKLSYSNEICCTCKKRARYKNNI